MRGAVDGVRTPSRARLYSASSAWRRARSTTVSDPTEARSMASTSQPAAEGLVLVVAAVGEMEHAHGPGRRHGHDRVLDESAVANSRWARTSPLSRPRSESR